MAEQPTEAAAPVKKTCAECKKPLKKAKWYYRNGNLYCNKNCFKKKMQAAAKSEQ